MVSGKEARRVGDFEGSVEDYRFTSSARLRDRRFLSLSDKTRQSGDWTLNLTPA